ncbi:MAG: phage portal protein [Defluviitaleaceae bacterium]|nr:phage portal protein [Defluviitaleaceae bacterium]
MVIKTGQALNHAKIIEIVNEKLAQNHRLQRLQDYYEGKQDIKLRHYVDPTKPNNRVVVNYCKKIADFHTAYLVGIPVAYEAPQIVLDTLGFNNEGETTQAITRNVNIMGFGCELLYTDEAGFPRFASIDPRESVFVMDDSIEGNLTAFMRLYPNADNPELYNLTVYTETDFTEYQLSRAVGELRDIGWSTHLFGGVPAILYANNPEYSGAFEGVMDLQDAINTVLSDEVNDFESFADAYLVLKGLSGTVATDLANMKQDRVLLLTDEGKAEWLIKQVNPSHIEQLKTSLITKIHEMGALPDIEKLGSFGASGVSLRFKLLGTEIASVGQERVIYRGLQRRLELIYNILRITDPAIGHFNDVNLTFERNFVMALDEVDRKRLDLSLVERHMLSKLTFLEQHKGMTPEEAREELHRVAVETYKDDWASDFRRDGGIDSPDMQEVN